ncbi:MAG: ATP-dependent DNA helicase RecG [Planctomycetes bacterium RIFCSPLOWO2_02_FULL_50_16]|nr:MAG: ATP-dependent DNA helicase RecG [Planctomycetes bacterium RIFCSPLOWO2_02_FULL_50_16]
MRVSTATTENPVYGSIQYLKGVGPWRAEVLSKLDLHTIRDLLYHFPRDYQDRSRVKAISEVSFNETTTIKGQIKGVRIIPTRGRKGAILEALVADDTGTIAATWFNMPYLRDRFKVGDEVLLYGRIHMHKYLQIINPEFEFPGKGDAPDPLSSGRIVPIYPLTEGVKQNYLRRLIRKALDDYTDYLDEILPEPLIKSRHLVPLHQAMEDAHFPENFDVLKPARRRFAYEEIFLFQAALAVRRQRIRSEKGYAFRIGASVDSHIRSRFPFKLTNAQERVLDEIRTDMQGASPMNRLLQGDVGSGKTVVALYALLVAVANGFQAAFMAPTEILAEQHNRTVGKYLSGSKVRTLLLVGGKSSKERKESLKKIKDGEVDLVIGTHALVSKDVQFKNLGMVVVDEQHKFGVLQRAHLKHKGVRPDVLVMTATPIPRSLSLTLFGDLDISIIDELPPGRTPVRTVWVTKRMYHEAYRLIQDELKKGRQVFVVYPLVEESEKLDLKSAVEGAETFRENFPEFKVGLLHGRLRQELKDAVMDDFRQRKIDILVSTIVIEVGIDIPNATVMVIEHAERFGLAQLHQLRGRIGRGSDQSYCLLFADPKTSDARSRLQTIVNSSNGFRIAEEDLRLRGPGEFFGTRQHGLPDYKVADLTKDLILLKTARDDAFKMIEQDGTLREYPLLRENVLARYTSRIRLASVV